MKKGVMRKVIILGIVMMFFGVGIQVSSSQITPKDNIVTNNNTLSTKNAEVFNMNQSKDSPSANKKYLEVAIPNLDILDEGDYVSLQMSGCSYISKVGAPMLPIKPVIITLPYQTVVSDVKVEIRDESSLSLVKQVRPALSPVLLDLNEASQLTYSKHLSESVQPTSSIYNANEFYPKEWFSYSLKNGLDLSTNTRTTYLIVWLYPVRYLPTTNEITIAQKVYLTINYENPAPLPLTSSKILNLIITSPLLITPAQNLCSFKNSTGIYSTVITTSWIYQNYPGVDNQQKIRNCITDFVSDYDIRYVTLFGDADQVPVRLAYVPDGEETTVATDLYYADLDGTWDDNSDGLYGDLTYDTVDGIPDVYVGRLPASLVSTANNMVNKIIGFANAFDLNAAWANKAILAAGSADNGGGSNFGTAFTFLNDYIDNMIYNMDSTKLYEPEGGLSNSILTNEINTGCFFLNFAGHGNPTDWMLRWILYPIWWEGFSASNAEYLTNGLKLPIVTTLSCSTARFDDYECIGEWFIGAPNGGGIAYFGSTRLAWGYIDTGVIYGLMGEMDWRIYAAFNEGDSTPGKMWESSISGYIQNHGLSYILDEKTVMEFELLGDPTINFAPRPSVVWVDDNFDNSYSGWGYNYFDSIQIAVNAVAENGTVYVFDGTYSGNVEIDKTINLIGENSGEKAITILNGGYIVISANGVTISGFQIDNGGSTCIYSFGNTNTITENSLFSAQGTCLYYSGSNNIISDNIMISGAYEYGGGGIYSIGSGINNTIINNTLTLSYENTAISVQCSESIISNNHISAQDSCLIIYGSENIVSDNNVSGLLGIDITGWNNHITRNDVACSGGSAIYLRSSTGNCIYQNNFKGYADDDGTNTWYNATLHQGNYWSNYAGVDANHDGIGDTPYNIPDGNNQDLYPLMTPFGPPHADYTNTINDKIVTFNALFSYDYDGTITNYNWDFGDQTNGQGQIIAHTYSTYQTYTVTLTVTDNDGKTDAISKEVVIVDYILPEISNIQDYPDPQHVGEWVNITCFVTDNDEVSIVEVHIVYPDSSTQNKTMNYNQATYLAFYNSTYLIEGIYSYYIWAKDINGNTNISILNSFEIINNPPSQPSNPTPPNHAIGCNLTIDLGWTGGDPDGDTVTYDVYFGISLSPPKVSSNQSETWYDPGTMISETKYYWKIVPWDEQGASTESSLWDFTTNYPPSKPVINGPTSGNAGESYPYTFIASDPEGGDIYYQINWGDGTVNESGPHPSNVIITLTHTWTEEGTYTIQARAKDTQNAYGEMGTLSVTMPLDLLKQSQQSQEINLLRLKNTIVYQSYFGKV